MKPVLLYELIIKKLRNKQMDVEKTINAAQTLSYIVEAIDETMMVNSISVKQLAKECRVRRSTINKMIYFKKMPRLDEVTSMLSYLGIRLYVTR